MQDWFKQKLTCPMCRDDVTRNINIHHYDEYSSLSSSRHIWINYTLIWFIFGYINILYVFLRIWSGRGGEIGKSLRIRWWRVWGWAMRMKRRSLWWERNNCRWISLTKSSTSWLRKAVNMDDNVEKKKRRISSNLKQPSIRNEAYIT